MKSQFGRASHGMEATNKGDRFPSPLVLKSVLVLSTFPNPRAGAACV